MKTSAVDHYLELYEETGLEVYMYLAEKADIAYGFVKEATQDNKRYMIVRCYSKLEGYVPQKDIDVIEEWVERILRSQEIYNRQ